MAHETRFLDVPGDFWPTATSRASRPGRDHGYPDGNSAPATRHRAQLKDHQLALVYACERRDSRSRTCRRLPFYTYVRPAARRSICGLPLRTPSEQVRAKQAPLRPTKSHRAQITRSSCCRRLGRAAPAQQTSAMASTSLLRFVSRQPPTRSSEVPGVGATRRATGPHTPYFAQNDTTNSPNLQDGLPVASPYASRHPTPSATPTAPGATPRRPLPTNGPPYL